MILLLYPAFFILLLLINIRFCKKGEFSDDLYTLNTAKNLQVIAAFGVILHHLVQHVSSYGEINKGPITAMNSMGILFTSIFFFSSGYGLISSYTSKENYLKGFFLKRFVKILIPFIITNIIYIIPSGVGEERIGNWVDILTSVFGITLMNNNAWFIVEILIFYVVFFLSLKLIKNIKLALSTITVFSLLMVVGSLLLGHDKSFIGGHLFMGEWWYNTTLIFPLGLWVGLYRERIATFVRKCYLLLLPVSILLFAGMYALEEYVLKHYGYYVENYTHMGYPQKAVTCLAQTVLCVLFVTMLVIIFYKLKTGNIILKLLSPITMELYLVHGIFLVTYDADNSMKDEVHFGVVIVASLICAVILYFIDTFIHKGITAVVRGDFKNKATTLEGKIKEKRINRQVKKYVIIISAFVGVSLIILVGVFIYNTLGRSIKVDKELNTIKEANVFDVVEYGHMDYEPINWIVIAKEDNKALLISKGILFECYYNQKHQSCTYEKSDVRKILTEEFIYEILYKKEIKQVVADSTTKDMIFLLSPDEVNQYLLNTDANIVVDNGSSSMGNWYVGKIKGRIWWLRGEEDSIMAPVVYLDGEIHEDGRYVNMSSVGVRPAMWVEY